MAFVGNRPSDMNAVLSGQRPSTSMEETEPSRLVIDMNPAGTSAVPDSRAPTPRMQQGPVSQVQLAAAAAAANSQMMHPYLQLAAAQLRQQQQSGHAQMMLQGAPKVSPTAQALGLNSAALSQLLQAQVAAQYPYSMITPTALSPALTALYYQQVATALQQQMQQQQQQSLAAQIIPGVVPMGTKTNLRITGEPPIPQAPTVPLVHQEMATIRRPVPNGQQRATVPVQQVQNAVVSNKPLALSSPEAVKEHISRLIEANEVIVEPSPVLLKRRTYHRQHAGIGEAHSLGSFGAEPVSPTAVDPRAIKMVAGRSQSLMEPLPNNQIPNNLVNPQLLPNVVNSQARTVLLCKFCQVEFWNQKSLEAHEFRCSKRESSSSQSSSSSPTNRNVDQRQSLKKRWMAQVEEDRAAKVPRLENTQVIDVVSPIANRTIVPSLPQVNMPKIGQNMGIVPIEGLFPQVSLTPSEESRQFTPYANNGNGDTNEVEANMTKAGKRSRNITETTFVCLKRPQPSFVQQHDSKLSMYSNWQQLPVGAPEAKLNILLMGACSTRPRRGVRACWRYTNAQGEMGAMRMIHSSFWEYSKRKPKAGDIHSFTSKPIASTDMNNSKSDSSTQTPKKVESKIKAEIVTPQKPNCDQTKENVGESSTSKNQTFTKVGNGWHKTNEKCDYIPGRGRGRYVCDRCGIRCKKPSMLKKHIRTHLNVRPYPCSQCSFSFKTKGNFTKHLKSKAHYKRVVTVPKESNIDENGQILFDSDSEDDDRLEIASPVFSEDTETGSERTRSPDESIEENQSHYHWGRSSLELRPRTASPADCPDTLQILFESRNCLSAPPTVLFREPLVAKSNVDSVITKPVVPSSPSQHYPMSNDFGLPTTVADAGTTNSAPEDIRLFLQGTEDNTKCELCGKEFRKTSELRLHMNVHYYNEQTNRNRYIYACSVCKTNLRSRALLQKHMETAHPDLANNSTISSGDSTERSSMSEPFVVDQSVAVVNGDLKPSLMGRMAPNKPRPFECTDCNIGFRIHGHLAKHLRSKSHAMKLEGQGKLPVGTFHRIETTGLACLNEVDTTDCDRALASLQQLAQILMVNEQLLNNTKHNNHEEEQVQTPQPDPELTCNEQLSPSPPCQPTPTTKSNENVQKSVIAGLWMPPKAEGLLENQTNACTSADNSASVAGAKLLLEAAAAAEGSVVSNDNHDSVDQEDKTNTTENTTEDENESKITKCRFCDIDFDNNKELNIHLHADHILMRDGKNFKCPRRNCEKVYPNKDNLRQHIAAHFYGGAIAPGESRECDVTWQAPGDVSRETMVALQRKLSANGTTSHLPLTGGGHSPGAPEETQTVGRAKLKTHLVKLNSIPECPAPVGGSNDFKSPSSVDNSPLSNESSDGPSRGSSRQSGESPCLPLPSSARMLIKRRSTEESVSPLASTSKRPTPPLAVTPTRPQASVGSPWVAQSLFQQNRAPMLAAAYWYSQQQLQHHVTQNETHPPIEIPCAVCGKTFVNPLVLQEHLLTHVCDRPHICSRCDAGFTTAQALAIHVETHKEQV